ncbi:recombinase family protein [Actinoplanes xinjiangensis]
MAAERCHDGRSLHELADIAATCRSRGVVIKSLTDGDIDTTSAHGVLAWGMYTMPARHRRRPFR